MRDASGTPLDKAQATKAFARIVREVFYGEDWESVEPYAERVWAHTVQAEAGLLWRDVRDAVRAEWSVSTNGSSI